MFFCPLTHCLSDLFVFNSLPWARGDLIEVPAMGCCAKPKQLSPDGQNAYVIVDGLPGMSGGVVDVLAESDCVPVTGQQPALVAFREPCGHILAIRIQGQPWKFRAGEFVCRCDDRFAWPSRQP